MTERPPEPPEPPEESVPDEPAHGAHGAPAPGGPADTEASTAPAPPSDPLGLARRIADSYRGGPPAAHQQHRRRRPPAGPRRTSREDPVPLAELLGEVVREHGWDERISAQRVFTDWPAVVGPEIAQHTTVTSFADGVLEVRTDSTAWATQLRLLAARLVARLNEELGHGSVLRIEVVPPRAPSWKKGGRSVRGRGPRDTYG